MTLEIRYLGHVAPFTLGETVLDALEKSGASVPSSCRAGACQFCMMRVVSGRVPKNSQDGLKESLRQTGHFLSCICRPVENLVCEPVNVSAFRCFVTIADIRHIGPDVVRVRFERPSTFEFTPGQFITLKRQDGVARSYSLASSAQEHEYFDIHVRHIANGRLSTWFHMEAVKGDRLWLEGPKGDCIYYPGKPDEPLTLIGTGTGIAPLYAIAVEALQQGHSGPITIYHGALSQDRFYFVDELKCLAQIYPNISYKQCVVHGPTHGEVHIGDLQEIVVAELSEAQLRRVYLCGDPGLVRQLKKHLFLAGVSLKRMHADPFIGTEKNTSC